MEYIKGNSCFTREQCGKKFTYLTEDTSCDVLIIGGGIDGAIANYYLSQNYDTILVDKGVAGMGCTSCATPLCEYQLDDYAHKLTKYMTEEDTEKVYRMGLESINELAVLVEKLGNNCHFALRPTLLYTNKTRFVRDIEREYQWRRNRGFDCTLIDERNNPMPFEIQRGIYCSDGGCCFNPCLLTNQLLQASSNGDKIFQHTKIDKIESASSGYIAYTNYGSAIKCNRVVLATGFNWEVINRNDICTRYVTYTIVTEPIDNLQWYNGTLCQDSGDPYHYFRVTHDNRIVFGGEDSLWNGAIDEKSAMKKYNKLFKQLKGMLPFGDQLTLSHRFCGAFGSTKNNLGVIGESSSGLYYFFSCGANGIVNAVQGVKLLDDLFNCRSNELSHLFSPQREI